MREEIENESKLLNVPGSELEIEDSSESLYPLSASINNNHRIYVSTEEAFRRSGGYGRYQIILAVIVTLYAWNNVIFPFTATYYELIPPLECENSGSYTPCKKAAACGGGDFKYVTNSEHPKNYVSEFDLACHSTLIGLIGSLFYFTSMFSSLLWGQVADLIGRKRTIALCSLFGVTGAALLLTAYSTPQFYVAIAVIAIGAGFSASDVFMIVDIIPRQYIPQQMTVFNTGFDLGQMFVAGLLYAKLEWRINALIILLWYSSYLLGYWYYLEPPRYYLSKRNYKEAKVQFGRLARKNGVREYEEDWMLEEEREGDVKNRRRTIIDIFRFSVTRYKFIIMGVLYCTVGLVVYGIAFALPKLYGNPKLNIFIGGAAGVVGVILSAYLVNNPTLGRKWTIFGSFLIASLGFAAYLIFGTPSRIALDYVLITIARFGISGAMNCINIYTAELFPTVVKATSQGSFVLLSKTGSAIAPLITVIDSFNPVILFTCATGIATFVTLLLPETKGTKLFETLETAQEYHIHSSKKKHTNT